MKSMKTARRLTGATDYLFFLKMADELTKLSISSATDRHSVPIQRPTGGGSIITAITQTTGGGTSFYPRLKLEKKAQTERDTVSALKPTNIWQMARCRKTLNQERIQYELL